MRDNNFKMVLVLTIIAAISAFILSFVYSSTKDKIADAYRQEFLRALVKVLPKYDNEPDKDVQSVEGKNVYVAKKDGQIVAYAVKTTSNKGYGGDIDVLLGVSMDGKITGIEIIKHAETPGLGSKIETETFKQSFKGLTVNDKIAVKKDGGVIDQFSGATISPRAVSEAVSSGLKFITEKVLEK
ncbi:RnfABCDGE type electron transport complex subunit G [Deferribacteraceae bacterium V6Fe1]|nr:RnfABCDGE type electron transport complex subunit G [Deferribacteraceae bacterium V6Fe1]